MLYLLLIALVRLNAQATTTLIATVRDFRQEHPDFETHICGRKHGMVEDTLVDSKPVFRNRGYTCQTTAANFNQWYNTDTNTDVTKRVNKAITHPLTFTDHNGDGVYTLTDNSFFPIDGQGFGNENHRHNYHFTMEFAAQFTYRTGQNFKFCGDDDVWVFINNKLVVDIGGIHGSSCADVNLDTLPLTDGSDYPFNFFFAERHTSGSNFVISLADIELRNSCGDGVVDGCEECDDGNTVDGDGCSSICEIEPTPAVDDFVTTDGDTFAHCETQAANDNICDATGLRKLSTKYNSVELHWDTIGATAEIGEPGNPANTVWYRFKWKQGYCIDIEEDGGSNPITINVYNGPSQPCGNKKNPHPVDFSQLTLVASGPKHSCLKLPKKNKQNGITSTFFISVDGVEGCGEIRLRSYCETDYPGYEVADTV